MNITPIDQFTISLENIRHHKYRSLMAIIGIVFSIACFIIVGLMGVNAKQLIFDEIQTFGFETVWVFKQNKRSSHTSSHSQSPEIKLHQTQSLQEKFPSIKYLSPVIQRKNWLKTPQSETWSTLLYVNEQWINIENDSLKWGRFINTFDIQYHRPVCVLGDNSAQELFGQSNPIGQQLLIGSTPTTIIGVLKHKDRQLLTQLGANKNNPNGRVLLPISIGTQMYGPTIDYIQFSATHTHLAIPAAKSVIRYLKQNAQPSLNYTFIAMKSYIDSANTILNTVSTMLILSLSITLLVGGIGITNIMTISVIERTKEIGIRRSLGATQHTLFIQFILEATLLSCIAGLIGTVLGLCIVTLMAIIIQKPFAYPPFYIFTGLALSVIIGIISGTYPATKAAHLNPADAIRSKS